MTNGGVIVVWINLDTSSRPHADGPDWLTHPQAWRAMCVARASLPPHPPTDSPSLSISEPLSPSFLSKSEITGREKNVELHKPQWFSSPPLWHALAAGKWKTLPSFLIPFFSLLCTSYHFTPSSVKFPSPPPLLSSTVLSPLTSSCYVLHMLWWLLLWKKGGKWFSSLACMAGLQLDTAPAAAKNKLTGACLEPFTCVCVCVAHVHAFSCVHGRAFPLFSAPAPPPFFFYSTTFVIPTLLLPQRQR